MRLIDADALQKEYKQRHDGKRLLLIDVAPTVQPERMRGRWVTNGTLINCSVCKHSAWSRTTFEDTVRSFNFCPNCGADMREGNT